MGSTYHLQISPDNCTRLVTKFQDGTLITIKVMSCQVHAIRKAIRPLLTDLVTNIPAHMNT